MQLKDHQLKAIEFIKTHPRCSLYMPMGSGKTVCVLTALSLCRNQLPALIIAPLRVAQTTWPQECAKWEHLQGLKVVAITAQNKAKAIHEQADIYTINYEQIPWLVQHSRDWLYKTIVCDESTRLRGFRLKQGSIRTRALAHKAWLSTFFIGLSGTPTPNGLLDLWGPTWFIDRGKRLESSYTRFVNRWFYSPFGRQMIGAPIPFNNSCQEIMTEISDVTHCVSTTSDEPYGSSDIIVNVTLPKQARNLYNTVFKDLVAEFDGQEVSAVNAAAKTIKCLQIANGNVYTDDDGSTYTCVHDEKLQALSSIVEEATGAPLLVAYHFRSDLSAILQRFPFAKHLDHNPQTIADWNAGKIKMLVAHPASCGHGLNLQDGGHHLVFYSIWWNLEEHQQIKERIGPLRQAQSGHKRPVFYYYILASNTLDEAVLKRLELKTSVQDEVLKMSSQLSKEH